MPEYQRPEIITHAPGFPEPIEPVTAQLAPNAGHWVNPAKVLGHPDNPATHIMNAMGDQLAIETASRAAAEQEPQPSLTGPNVIPPMPGELPPRQ